MKQEQEKVLVTGGAGFIGSHLVDRLLAQNCQITCIDNFDSFYSPNDKRKNIEKHLQNPNYQLIEADIRDLELIRKALGDKEFDAIIHLAAKAGVRPSIQDPLTYTAVNITGTQNMLEIAREKNIPQFVFASSSSVYGVNPNVPWREDDNVLQPISPYAATKLSGEFLGHTYSHLHGIRFIGLRFFTVYGPRQRPDLAIRKFLTSVIDDKPIDVYGDGSTRRDYTYVDDIVDGVIAALNYKESNYEIINLGNNKPIELRALIEKIEQVTGKKAILNRLPQQPGDVPQTYADIRKAQCLLNYNPSTTIDLGLEKTYQWLNESFTK